MHPTCRQVPPRNPSFSMTRVFKPHWDARMAATYPPGPLPIIARSYAGKVTSAHRSQGLSPGDPTRRVQDQSGKEGRAHEVRHRAGKCPREPDKDQILATHLEARNLQRPAKRAGCAPRLGPA